jgi:riboflavin transporter FmnP
MDLFAMDSFESILRLVLSCVVAGVFITYIYNFLNYHYAPGEVKVRGEAVDKIIDATSILLLVVLVWVVYRFLFGA